MTITCSPPFVVCVSTVCWGVLFRLPAAWLCLRSRWMVSNTAPAIDREGPAQLRGPGQVAGHVVDHLRERHQRHEARLEARLLGGLLQLAALQGRVLLQPRAELADLARVAGAEQHLREQLVGIERDGRQQLVEVGGVEPRRPAPAAPPRRAGPRRAGQHRQGHEPPDRARRPSIWPWSPPTPGTFSCL